MRTDLGNKKLLALLVLTTFFTTATAVQASTLDFGDASTYLTGGKAALSLRAADLDGDGKKDLVTVDESSDAAFVLKGSGDGTFTVEKSLTLDDYPHGLVLEDLNGDGIKDLITTSMNNNSVNIYTGTGDSSFFSSSRIRISFGYVGPGIRGAISVAAADINSDERKDIVVGFYGNAYSVITNNYSSGTFSSSSFSYTKTLPATSFSGNDLVVSLADIDNDTYTDLLIRDPGAEKLRILRGNNDGTFDDGGTGDTLDVPGYFLRGRDTTPPITTDYDNNGTKDIFASGETSVTVLSNDNCNAGTAFNNCLKESTIDLDSSVVSLGVMAVVDLDNDTNLDVAINTESSSDEAKDQVLAYLGNGSGFTYDSSSSDSSDYGLIAEDLNDDSYADLASVSGGAVKVLLAIPPDPPTSTTTTEQGTCALENTSPPVVTGSAVIDGTLSSSSGSWSCSDGVSLSYQWQRCSADTCSDISGASQATYTVGDDDLGYNLRSVVTATDSQTSVNATSAQVGPVTVSSETCSKNLFTVGSNDAHSELTKIGKVKARLYGPSGSFIYRGNSERAYISLKGKNATKAVSSVSFYVDDKLVATDNKRPFKATISSSGLSSSSGLGKAHTLKAQITTKNGEPVSLTAGFTVGYCSPASFSTKFVSIDNGRSDLKLISKSGGPNLSSVRYTLAKQVKFKPKGNKTAGKLRIVTTSGNKSVALKTSKQVKSSTRKLTLANSSNGKVVLSKKGSGWVVTISGLPSDTTELTLTIKGKKNHFIEVKGNCKKTKFSAQLTDQNNNKETLTSTQKTKC